MTDRAAEIIINSGKSDFIRLLYFTLRALIDFVIFVAELTLFFFKHPVYFFMGGMTFVLIFSLPIRNPILTWERRFVRNTSDFVSKTIDISEKMIAAIQNVLQFLVHLIPGV